MPNELVKFILDSEEIEISDETARTSAATANETANVAKSNAETNTTDINKIKNTTIVKTCTYNSENKTMTIMTGVID